MAHKCKNLLNKSSILLRLKYFRTEGAQVALSYDPPYVFVAVGARGGGGDGDGAGASIFLRDR